MVGAVRATHEHKMLQMQVMFLSDLYIGVDTLLVWSSMTLRNIMVQWTWPLESQSNFIVLLLVTLLSS